MISTRGRYALRVLVDLAENQGVGYITFKEIAGRQEISEKYLEGIVKELVRAGILEGLRGKGGGYRRYAGTPVFQPYPANRKPQGAVPGRDF